MPLKLPPRHSESKWPPFYVAKARFRNGGASFRIGLVKRDDQWMINSFYVDLVPPQQPGRRT